jgi:hypothetical protein
MGVEDAQLWRRFKVSAIGATSVTLIPSTAEDSENHPNHLPISQIVVSTNAAAPPAEFWDAITEYLVGFDKRI